MFAPPRRLISPALVCLFATVLVAACATSPLGRRQLVFMPEASLTAMGIDAFRKLKSEKPLVTDPKTTGYVQCVAAVVAAQASGANAPAHWEVVVFDENDANAFALPGGKIGVYRGLLDVAETPAQLATVIGHEIGHVLARHANERVSTSLAADLAVAGAGQLAGSSPEANIALAALGLGAQVGVLLPFSREQEREADLLGLDLMARAGFDPRESIDLWRNMARAGGARPPEFLSTHPAHQTRIRELEQRMPRALSLYEAARRAGRAPACARP